VLGTFEVAGVTGALPVVRCTEAIGPRVRWQAPFPENPMGSPQVLDLQGVATSRFWPTSPGGALEAVPGPRRRPGRPLAAKRRARSQRDGTARGVPLRACAGARAAWATPGAGGPGPSDSESDEEPRQRPRQAPFRRPAASRVPGRVPASRFLSVPARARAVPFCARAGARVARGARGAGSRRRYDKTPQIFASCLGTKKKERGRPL